jgi:hypothetical protein
MMGRRPVADLVDYIDCTSTLTIATRARDGREITTPIWGVVVDGVPYVRSGYGETSGWYRRLRRTGRAAFVGRGVRFEARVELVQDEAERVAVDHAYRAKYRGHGIALTQSVESAARDFTLRLVRDDWAV